MFVLLANLGRVHAGFAQEEVTRVRGFPVERCGLCGEIHPLKCNRISSNPTKKTCNYVKQA